MNHFRFITHLEAFPVIARMHKLAARLPHDDILVLRERDAETETYIHWKSLQALLGRARKAIGAPDAALGAVCLERLPPCMAEPWGSTPDSWPSFRIPLITNPLAIDYVGHESVHMAVGALWWMNVGQTHCSANWGSEPRYHLMFEVAKPRVASADPI